MAVALFQHNQTAYESALAMLKSRGRAAVIHPTGTGKSFIAFALCENFPKKKILWLSPSEHIFATQQENWKAAGGEELKNIYFLTYARLMRMEEEEIQTLSPDYIILDEFHRCGARMWGQGVDRLLDSFSDVPVLGLSATSIRYLDSQRDMAQELFGGNVASEMTLGEAVVRGILNPPKYVLSLYSYQKDLERYERRVKTAKNKAVREEAEKYLEALKRALSMAEGMDEIFRKHMIGEVSKKDAAAERCYGKYLVFCADYEHMQEMIGKVPEWFGKVDPHPHVYQVYSEDAQAGEVFREFKEDTSSHLKLLFCIDMLNEGIHVEDVSGVILLRPTVSPVVYRQQIGRALTAGGKRCAVIFDVVLNIENLYSIGSLEEEMQAAVSYYRSLGLEGEIVREHFQVTDEVGDSRKLFAKLDGVLGASWERMYAAAERYHAEHGDLEAPKRYVTEEGLSLGQWLDTQRKVYAGKVSGHLTEEQKKRLDLLDMRWQGKADASWEKYYDAAKRYYAEHGDMLVNVRNGRYAGVDLGKWLAQMRVYRKGGIKNAFLTEERVKALDAIGMVWDVPDYLWEQNYAAAMRYHREHGNLEVPYHYIDKDGVRLGAWLANVRSSAGNVNSRRAELTKEQRQKLDELGMLWNGKNGVAWERSYAAACRYQKKYGDLNIPVSYVTEDGLRLGRWIRRQRDAYRTGLTGERRRKLDAIGVQPEAEKHTPVRAG